MYLHAYNIQYGYGNAYETGWSMTTTEWTERAAAVVEDLAAAVWGWPILTLLLGTGIYFTIRLKFFQIRCFVRILRDTIIYTFRAKPAASAREETGAKAGAKGLTQFQAMTTALAASLGTGNIVGVATALTMGGAGAIFWMWVSAIFGMMTSYAENVLGILYRTKNEQGQWRGGPMHYIERGLKCKPLALAFAFFCMSASFGIGNMTQVNSIATALETSLHIPALATGIAVAALAFLVIVGGIGRIGRLTEKLIPALALCYTGGAVVLLVLYRERLPMAFGEIFAGAFDFSGGKAAFGGVMGAAVSWGIKRGVFSNEAGLGSAVIVHAASDVDTPVRQGMWGVFEVFVDTILMCTLTALVILATGALDTGAQGAALAIAAFSGGFGNAAGLFVSLAIAVFAFSTLLGWSYYGERAAEYLFNAGAKAGTKSVAVYRMAYICAVLLGATTQLSIVWGVSDILNGLMAVPNILAVLFLSNEVLREHDKNCK